MRESIPGFFCDGLTKITLITNTDGVHTIEEVIGYVAEQDFCILSDMINQYYISKYNDIELFPANFFSGKYTIGIYNLGSRYDLDNFVKSYYPDMPRFIYNHKILERAEIDNDDIDMVKEYATFLNNRADEIESIKEAIEYSSAIKAIDESELTEDDHYNFAMKATSELLSVDKGENGWFWEMLSYIIKKKCWEYGSN